MFFHFVPKNEFDAPSDETYMLTCRNFDVIDHIAILLVKLRWYGIETEWFEAYLRGHT